MKVFRVALSAALAAGLAGTTMAAQPFSSALMSLSTTISQPNAPERSPSDVQPPMPGAQYGPAGGAAQKNGDCGAKCGSPKGGADCACSCYSFGPDEAWTLFPAADACNPLSVGGWFQIGYHTEGKNGVGTDLFNSNPNQVQLHQAWVYVEKAIDEDACGWDYGFRFDYVYGTDGPDTQAFGGRPDDWDNDWDHGGNYGHAIPQLYVELGNADLKVKVGHFYTIVGYEVVAAPDNFFYSHAYTQYLAEPFTHTGILAEYALNDGVTVYGGWTQGWDTGFSRNGGDTFLGGISIQVAENATLIYATTMGDFGFGDGGSDSNGYSHSIVLDVDVTDNLKYVFQSDLIDNDIFLGSQQDLIGVNQYLLYTINDCWGVGARLEWFDDPRMQDEVVALTTGVNYKPHANVVIRPEVRWNWFGDGAVTPVSNVPAQDETLFGLDVIMTW